MNTPNNKRKKESQKKIQKVFIQLIQSKEIHQISVTEICERANLNRSTFYANYLDIYDLANKITEQIEEDVSMLYQEERETRNNTNNYLKLFQHIKENQNLYKTYFKLNGESRFIIKEYDTNLSKLIYNNQYIDYHFEFFMSGLNAIIKKWLENDCKESPEIIDQILKDEYKNKNIKSI